MKTNTTSIVQILLRDLGVLKNEISSYPSSDDLWLLGGDVKNSAGNLVLHLCGNLQFFVGAILGKSGYERHREQEFSQTGLSKAKLLVQIDTTKKAVESAFRTVTDQQLEQNYPIEVFGKPMTYSYFLIHLTGHLMYHLGQINYHRRLLTME